MKRPAFRWTIVALATVLLSVSAFAVPVTDDQAATAAASLVAAGGAMDAQMEGGVSEVRALTPPDGAAPFHVVKFAEGGFIVTSGDTEDDPFVFISDGAGDVVEDDENPLWGILRHNMSANEAVRATNATARSRGVRVQSVSTAENKWAKWLSGGNGRVRSRDVAVPGTSISDICVPRIMDVRWNQRGSGNASHYYNDAIPHHCAVGCVAVAVGQIIRHYQWPSTIGVVTNTCKVWNGKHGDESEEESVDLTTSGAVYDWDAMPAEPARYANPPGQAEVSRFLYDVGVTVAMQWEAPEDDTSVDGGNGGSYQYEASYALKHYWGYADTILADHYNADTGNTYWEPYEQTLKRIKNIYLTNLAAGMPVCGEIFRHAVVIDGYGYSDGNMYFHVNFGWGGTNAAGTVSSSTGWYVATRPLGDHGSLKSAVYNISTNHVGALFSGRIYGSSGLPLGNFPVTAVGEDGASYRAVSNPAGVYCFNLEPGHYAVYATNGVQMAYDTVATFKSYSTNVEYRADMVGNVSEVDLRLGTPDKFIWTGGGDGHRFGDAGNWDLNQVPTNGATIVLAAASGDLTLNNDLSDFQPSEIVFTPSPYSCTITNNALNGVNRILNGSSATNLFKVAVAFVGDIDVLGIVAFTDGGSATGVKPVNHSEYLGTYNLTTPAWTPDAGAVIASNSIVNVASMQLTEAGVLVIRAGGTLNVNGDVVLSNDKAANISMPIVHTNDGEINILGHIQIDGHAAGYPCRLGNGTIRVRGIVNDSLAGGFYLNPCSGDYAVSWEIGEDGLAGTKAFYFESTPEQPTIHLKALADFAIDNWVRINRTVVLDTDGHTVTINARFSSGEGSLTLTGGGVVRSTDNVIHRVNDPINLDIYVMSATVVVESGTTLVLDSGAYPTKGACTICPGAILVLPQNDPSYSVKFGTLQVAGGATLVVSNFVGDAVSFDAKSFERTGTGHISLHVTAPTPVLRRGALATGVGAGGLSWFSLDECNVGGSNAMLELVNGTLFVGSPAVSYAWNGTQSDWFDAGAWTLGGSAAAWASFNHAVFATPGSVAYLSSTASVSKVVFNADATIVGGGYLSVLQVYVARGVVGTISVPFAAGVEKIGPGTLVFTQSRARSATILSEGTLKVATGEGDAPNALRLLSFGSDHSKEVAIDYDGRKMSSPKLDTLLQDGIRITLTNGVFGAGYDDVVFTEAHLPAVLTVAKGAVMSNAQHKVNINDGSTRVINIAGGKMFSTRKSNNHYLLPSSASGRLDINVTDGGLLEFWYELYALTCRDGEGYVDPSLRMTFKDSTFRITNNKSFRFGWDGNNKNAVAPVGVFAATNSIFEAYGFFLGHDKIGTNTGGSYTADFEGSIVSARQVRVFHDRPLNAIRFNNTRLVLTEIDNKWLTESDEFGSRWQVKPITIGEGGLVMDSNGKNGSLVADPQGPGAITKAGLGTLTISRSQTGAGPLICQAGRTDIGCDSVARPITVKDGASLAVITSAKASFGQLTLERGATLSILGSMAGTAPMSVSALTLPASGTATLQNNGGPFPVGTYAILEMPGITVAHVQRRLVPQLEGLRDYSYFVENGVLKLVVETSDGIYVPAVAPTCELPGSIAYLLDSAGNFYDTNSIMPQTWADIELQPLGHEWGAWTVVTPASYAAAGVAARDCSRCGAHETQVLPMLQHSKFSMRNSGNTFYITRSSGATSETVFYRTVGISAYRGQHFVNNVGYLTFAPGVTNMSVTVTEQTPSQAAYRYQTGTTRSYRLELTDAGGFHLVTTPPVRSMTTGSQFSTTYLNRSVTNLVYFSNGGTLQSGTGNKYLDVTYGPSSYRQVTDGGYKQAVHTISTGNLFGNSSDLRSYLHSLSYKMYATIYFTQKEEQDGYQYIQILADNSTTYDGDDGDGTVSNPQISLYKACFILSYSPSGSVMENDHYQFFPHRYDYQDKAAEKTAGISQYEFDYDNSHLYRQAYRSSLYKTLTSGSLVLPVTSSNLNVRFDAAGSGGDTWDFKNMKARLALVDATPPAEVGVALSDGPYHRGNTVTVSFSFSEIVVPTPSSGFYLNTSWGPLGYESASSGGNVLTFSGKIGASDTYTNGTRLASNGFSGLTSLKDLAGNDVALERFVIPNLFPAAISESVDYAISYDLAGGTLPPDEDPNPATYNYDSDIITLTNPVRPGYIFAGWSGTGLNGIVTQVSIGQHKSGDRAYTAHWTPVAYPISYANAMNGVAGVVNTNPGSYTVEDDTIMLSAPTRTGYMFDGWFADAAHTIPAQTTFTASDMEPKTFYASWIPITYTLRFDANGGTGEMDDIPLTYDVPVQLPPNAFVLIGRTFMGWTGPNAVAYANGATVTNLTEVDGAVVTFSATWGNTDWANDGCSGDSEADAYLIYTPRQLDLLAQRVNDGNSYSGKFFRVMADIAYDPSVPNNFTPIGEAYVSTAKITVEPSIEYSFDGTFDGNGHILSGICLSQAGGGMRIALPEAKVAGLFCKCGSTATIKNLILANAEIEGDYAGGIIGKCEGTVSNCFVIGTTVTAEQGGGVIAGDVTGSVSLVGNNYHDCVLIVYGESYAANIGTPEGDIPGGAEECYAITAVPGVVVASEPDFAFLVCGVTNRCWKADSPVRLEYADPLSAGQLAVFSVNGEQIAGNVFEMPATNATVSAIVTDGHVWNVPAYAWADDYSCVTGTVSSSSGDYFHESVFAATSVVSRAATCTETGETTWIADVPQDNVFGFATQTIVQHGVPVAVGHIWVKKSWTWAEDCSAASVLLECARCDAQTNVSAVVTLAGKTWDAFTWRATAEIDGQTFTDYPMFQDREKYTVEAGVGEGGSFKVCYVKSNAWEDVLVDFAEIDFNVSPKDRHKSPAGESIYIVPKDSELAVVSASASGEPLSLLWDSGRGLSYFIMPAHAVTVSVVFDSKYPRYLDGADDDVWDCYYEWAAAYGNDVFGTNEVAFLLNVAPEAVTNGVTLLKIVELGVTNRLVSESGDYGLVAQEMLGYREDDYLTYRRIVLASDVTELTQRSAFGYQGDICNGYLVLHIGIDLSEPRENWLAFSWPCEVVDGQVVLEFPELLLEKYRESVARDTGKPCNSLFFSASISTQQGDPPYELMAAIYQAMDQGGYEESEP